MITLYGFGPGCGLPDPSPFVTKVETLLRMANLPYRIKVGAMGKAPKGKLPYIDDDGVLVPDSTFIRWHLEDRHGIDFDAGYSPAERGIATAFERLIEDHAYWGFVDVRWLNARNFEIGPARFFKGIPAFVRPVVVGLVKRKIAKSLHTQGFGRHSRAEIERLVIADFEAIAAFLGDKPFLLGDRPCGADATVFAFLMGALCPIFETPIRDTAEKHANLTAYVARMEKKFFPEGFSAPV